MRTIIAGSRTLGLDDVFDAMDNCPWTATVVISGCARGVDVAGERWAVLENIQIERFPADWEAHGKRAGYLRNEQMAEHAEALVAVWDQQSRGTKNMIDIATRKGLKVFFWTPAKKGAGA